MNRTFFLSALLVLLTGATAMATTDGRYTKINIADFCNHPEVLNGRLVEVSARVIAINADSNSMELFDSESRTMIVVKMADLPKAQRNALVNNDIRRVTVAGRASMVGGRLVIDARRIEAVLIVAGAQAETPTEIVPIAN
jgi:hypothetical protein